jgi:hypothetical protein
MAVTHQWSLPLLPLVTELPGSPRVMQTTEMEAALGWTFVDRKCAGGGAQRGREASGTGPREKLDCKAAPTKVLADPQDL